jgi:integrase
VSPLATVRSDQDADIRFRVKHDVAVFNRPFRQVAEEYLQTQQRRADTGEVSHDRVKDLRNAFKKALEDYVGSTQIHLIGQDRWAGYPTWRWENGKGRFRAHISDSTIAFEMGALNAVMNFAITKLRIPIEAGQGFRREAGHHSGLKSATSPM